MNSKQMEIFWGTGGVGKTTLAASRALFLSGQGKRVLLMTIDPSKRLRQIFDVEDELLGKVVEWDSFEVLVFTPDETFKKILGDEVRDGLNNRIMNILMRPYGGMNEIMAVLEIQYQLKRKRYDTIILDTPPGKHFVDFAQSSQKINRFFEKKFMEVIKYYTKNVDLKSRSIFNLMAQTGMDKILKYMKMVTGDRFLEEFVHVIWGLYSNKDVFMETLDFEKKLQRSEFCHWFLVTSVALKKLKEVIFLHDELKKDFYCEEHLVVNKSLMSYIDDWSVAGRDGLGSIKKSMKEGERRMLQLAEASFEKTLVFPEILSSSPQEHIEALSLCWKKQNEL